MAADTAFGKMCRAHSLPITDLTLPMCLALWRAGAFLFLSEDGEIADLSSTTTEAESLSTVSWTHSFSEFPNEGVESSLSSILERGGVDNRYYLSKKACEGILRRAETMGKELPKELKEALEGVVQSQ